MVTIQKMYAENEPAMKRNEAVLSGSPGKLYAVEANYKIPVGCKYLLALIEVAKNQRQPKTDDLVKLLELKIGAFYVKYSDEQAGSKALRSSYDRQTKLLESY